MQVFFEFDSLTPATKFDKNTPCYGAGFFLLCTTHGFALRGFMTHGLSLRGFTKGDRAQKASSVPR